MLFARLGIWVAIAAYISAPSAPESFSRSHEKQRPLLGASPQSSGLTSVLTHHAMPGCFGSGTIIVQSVPLDVHRIWTKHTHLLTRRSSHDESHAFQLR
jgi:hypothetical protein